MISSTFSPIIGPSSAVKAVPPLQVAVALASFNWPCPFAAQAGSAYYVHLVDDLLDVLEVSDHRLEYLFQVESGHASTQSKRAAGVVPLDSIELKRVGTILNAFFHAVLNLYHCRTAIA